MTEKKNSKVEPAARLMSLIFLLLLLLDVTGHFVIVIVIDVRQGI